MRHLYCLLLVLCCLNAPLFPAPHALAADVTTDKRLMQVRHIAPIWSTDSLRIIFSPDEQECRKLYGNEWRERCFVALGMDDAPATGVVLRGEHTPKGQWRWENYTMLTFTPESPWQANTAFSVDMRKLPLPPRVTLNSRTIEGRTLPLAGQSDKGEVWIDPSVSGTRAVSVALYFTAPVDKSIEKQWTIQSDTPSLGLGKMQIIWGQDLTSCLVKIPITELPKTAAIVRLQVTGIRPLSIKGYASNSEATRRTNSWSDTATVGNGTLIQTVSIPAKKTLFRVNTAAMTLERTENLTLEYRLALKTSLRVPTADILKALKVVELPTLQNPEATVPYRWTAAPAITQADLDKARPLKVELVNNHGNSTESGELIVLRVPATPGSYVYCLLPAEFGPAGYPLHSPWTAVFQAMPPESSVNFLQPGNVLTLTPEGDNRLDIVSTGVDTIRWRASRLGNNKLTLLQIATPSHDRFRPYDNMDIASTAVEGRIPLAPVQQGQLSPRFSTLALSELVQGGTGFMYVELTGLRAGKEVAATSRLVLATNLGMVSKVLPDGGRQVFVCSLSTGQPVKDAVVRILGANGQPVAEARTDAAGQANLPAVRGLTREKEAVALVASRSADKNVGAGEDITWMSLDDAERRVDYSRFPTQGQISSPDNINVYVFGQRGIFRPGETLRFGLVIRRGNWQPLPPDMPLVATLTDPAGRVAMQRTLTVAEGIGELSWPSPPSAPTGRYRLDISSPVSDSASGTSTGGYDIWGSGAVRVEEFQPDTLAIRAMLTPPSQKDPSGKGDTADQNTPTMPKGWLVTPAGDASASLTVYLRNFYGLPAEGRKIRADLSVRPATLHFTGFEDFTFPDIMPLSPVGEAATATRLPDNLTNTEGQSQVPLPLSVYQSRTMQCRVLVEGFEPDGGRAVTTESNFLVSPLPIMLGYRPTGAVGSIGYVPQGTKGGLDFVVIGPDLRPADPGELRLSVAERRYVTVLATDSQGKYVYEESPVDKEISGTSAKVDPATGTLSWTMPTTKAGEFLLTVRDSANKLMARIPFTVAGNDDVRPALAPQGTALPSTQLRLRLDKTDYAPGDTVNILMASPYDGVGLISLERDTVASHVWFKAPAGHSVHTLTIPKDFEGRGYINVTMGRAISSPEIFMQPHSFAVAPLTVNAAGRDMGLALTAPQEILPGTSLNARLTSRHAGKALIFAVDEGVLQLTNFSTPDPLRYLLLDRALEVQTDQLFDLLMPVHAQMGKRLPAFGGDMANSGGRFQNPFKRRSEPPLAWWSSIVDVNAQGTDVTIPIPAYSNGKIRLMAVAVSASTVGSTQASTVARAPLVISPQLPLMAAPKDRFEGGINLHNTTTKPLTVTLQVEHTGLIVESGPSEKNGEQTPNTLPKTVEIAPKKELFVPLHCVAGDMPREATLTIVAHAQAAGEEGQTFRRSATLSIRPAVLPQQELRTGFAPLLTGGKLPTDALTRKLYPFKASNSASVSTAPLPPLRVLLQALQVYPYTCVEQSISRALPLVLLQRRAGVAAMLTPPFIDGKPRSEVHAGIMEQALNAIRGGFKRYDGMAPWPDAMETSTFLTAYAGDYLLSLKEAGLTLPGDLSTAFFETLQGRMDRAPESLAMARAQAYGLWVLTRHGLITTQWLDTLREQLDDRWPQWNKDVTASLMAGSYALMNMHNQAQELLHSGIEGALLEPDDAQPMNALAARALHVAVLARHFPARLEGSAGTLAARLVEGINTFGGSTFESALGARALLELVVPVSLPAAKAVTETAKATPQATADPFAGAELLCMAYQEGFSPIPVGDSKASKEAGKAMDAKGGARQAGQKALPTLLALSAPGCTQFSINMPIATPVYWELTSDGYDRHPPSTAATNGMQVQRVYKLADGTPLAPLPPFSPDTAVPQGTVLRVELTARMFGTASKNSTPVVLADLLPGGFEFVLTHPDDALPTTENGVYTRLERREDRVLAYTSVGDEAKTFVYHVRAVNRGRYTLPAAYGEGLYDRTLNSHTAAGGIRVQ